MTKIVRDFVNAGINKPCGYFEGDAMAAHFSRHMSRNQRKKCRHHGSIPTAFLDYLRESGIIKGTLRHNRPIILWQLLDILRFSAGNNDTAAYLYKEIMKDLYPRGSRSFETAQPLWDRLQNGRVEVENFNSRW